MFFLTLLIICFCITIRGHVCVVECRVIRYICMWTSVTSKWIHFISIQSFKKGLFYQSLIMYTMKWPWEAIIKLRKSLLLNVKWAIFELYHVLNKLHVDEMKMMMSVHCVLDKHNKLDFYSASWDIIQIPSQPVFALTPLCCKLSGKATYNIPGLTQPGLEHMIYLE